MDFGDFRHFEIMTKEHDNRLTRKLLVKRLALIVIVSVVMMVMWILPQSETVGPWRAQVVDAETQQPLDGAVVLVVFWKRYAGVGGWAGGGYYHSEEAVTDKSGNFVIQSQWIFTWIPFLSTIQGPEFYIFKPGYGGWRFQGEARWGESWQNGRMVGVSKLIMPLSERSKFLDEVAKQFESDGIVIELQPLKIEEERRRYQSLGAMPCCDIPEHKMQRYLQYINQERALLGCKPLPRKSIFLEVDEKPC